MPMLLLCRCFVILIVYSLAFPYALAAQSIAIDSLSDKALQKADAFRSLPDSIAPDILASPRAARDSLLQPLTTTRDSVQAKLDSLFQPVRSVADTLQQHYESAQSKVQSVSDTLQGLIPDEVRQVAGEATALPPVPTLPSLPPASLGQSLPSLQQVNLPQRFGSPAALEKLTAWKTKLGQGLPAVPGSVQQGLPASQDLSGVAEQQAGRLSGVDQLPGQPQDLASFQQKQMAPVSEYTTQASSLSNMEQIQQQMKQQAMQGAQRHFQEHGEALEQGQAQLSKLKKKYKTVQSEKDVYQRATSLKGEPWITRLLVGSYFQVHRAPSLQVDVSPFVGYRFNTRWSVGLGGIYRVSDWRLSPTAIYGGRGFVESIVYKGFALHAEYEQLRVPESATIALDKPAFHWQQGVLVGISRPYQISKHISGTALLLHNFTFPTDPARRTAYPSRWNLRLGFFLSH